MKPIDRSEVLGLADYEAIRDRFRARVIDEKKLRRVALGPKVSALFENRDTVLLQIQEMLRTERITRPAAVDHEIETYSETIPGEDELSCTLMIEIPQKDERDAFLRAAAGIERRVAIVSGERRVIARSAERDGAERDRATAVSYLKFSLPRPLAEALRAKGPAPEIVLEVDHPQYSHRSVLGPATVEQLREDLRS
jgi:hypothetical protein